MILNGQRLYNQPVECEGLLIVGDPHVSSIRPGRRTDPDWPGPILRKLEFCAKISQERKLATIFLGDLFNSPVETDEGLKTQLARILNDFHFKVVTNTGNHDIQNTALSDGDSLAYLGTSDTLDVVAKSGPVFEVIVGGKRIGIGMTPYGQDIPSSVEGLFPKADAVVWFTHHDIAFDKSYPGAKPPIEIKGCGLVVNGHMHDTKDIKKVGATVWYNPGNINRMSVDLMDHVPSAWVLSSSGRMEQIKLPYEKSTFDLTGRFVEAVEIRELEREVESAFVTLLQAESTAEMAASKDGSLLAEEIAAKFDRDKTPAPVRNIVNELLIEAARRRNAA